MTDETQIEIDDCADETFIIIRNMEEWNEFCHLNADALWDIPNAFELACDHDLMIGGGAAPLFRIGFVG